MMLSIVDVCVDKLFKYLCILDAILSYCMCCGCICCCCVFSGARFNCCVH